MSCLSRQRQALATLHHLKNQMCLCRHKNTKIYVNELRAVGTALKYFIAKTKNHFFLKKITFCLVMHTAPMCLKKISRCCLNVHQVFAKKVALHSTSYERGVMS